MDEMYKQTNSNLFRILSNEKIKERFYHKNKTIVQHNIHGDSVITITDQMIEDMIEWNL